MRHHALPCTFCGNYVRASKMMAHHKTKTCRYQARLALMRRKKLAETRDWRSLQAAGITCFEIEAIGNKANQYPHKWFAPSWAVYLQQAVVLPAFKALDKPLWAFMLLMKARDNSGFRDEISSVIAMGGLQALAAYVSQQVGTADTDKQPACEGERVRYGLECASSKAQKLRPMRYWALYGHDKPELLEKAAWLLQQQEAAE